jgi:hypothetical protein
LVSSSTISTFLVSISADFLQSLQIKQRGMPL